MNAIKPMSAEAAEILKEYCATKSGYRKTISENCCKLLGVSILNMWIRERMHDQFLSLINRNGNHDGIYEGKRQIREGHRRRSKEFLSKFLNTESAVVDVGALVYNCQLYCPNATWSASFIEREQLPFMVAYLKSLGIKDFAQCETCDPCKNEANHCDKNAICKWKDESISKKADRYSCECKPGYQGDGKTCRKSDCDSRVCKKRKACKDLVTRHHDNSIWVRARTFNYWQRRRTRDIRDIN